MTYYVIGFIVGTIYGLLQQPMMKLPIMTRLGISIIVGVSGPVIVRLFE